MKAFLFYLFYAYLALSVQGVLFRGVKPDLVLILVCIYSLKYGKGKGVTYGALTGLLVDTASGFILGPNILSKSFAAFFMRSIRENVFHWDVFINTIIIAIVSVIDIFLVYFCLEFFSTATFINRSWNIPVMQAIYTVAFSVPLYVVMNPEKSNPEWRG
jgi:rod shape-determining protein MreD